MWSSWVKRKGTTQVMYITKLKDGLERVKKTSQWFWKGFLKWYDGGGENEMTSKRIFEIEVFFLLSKYWLPLLFEDSCSFSFLFSLFLYVPSLEDSGVLMIFD
jgi:hypothetical protein